MRRRFILSCLAAPWILLPEQEDELVWREYLAWFSRQTGALPDVRTAYLNELLKQGLAEDAARSNIAIIERMRRERPGQWQRAFFDHTYRSSEPRFQTSPNVLLAETVKSLKPGLALDIHMGQGRNAIHLARLGWQVTGFDYSAAAIEAARKLAQSADVHIDAVLSTHEDFDFGVARWDLIVMSYTWVPLDAPWTSRIVNALRPGGILVFEHLMDASGSENAAAWLPRPGQLPQTFAALRILRYEDVHRRADWSWRPERVARLVAAKSPVASSVDDR